MAQKACIRENRFLKSLALFCALAASSTTSNAQDPQIYQGPYTVSVKNFGAVGDGVTDDYASIIAALDDVISQGAGGGVIFFPEGIYRVPSTIPIYSGVTYKGAGTNRTTVTRAPNSSGHIMEGADVHDVLISDLTLDGGPSHAGGHGIRIGDSAQSLRLERIRVINTFGYGIGLQAGPYNYVNFDDVEVRNTGSDGIDFKNSGQSLSKNIVLNNVRVFDPGNLDDHAAIDLRGEFHLTNLVVGDLLNNSVGIRFRSGELGASGGPGGHESILRGFRITANNCPGCIGVEVAARGVMLSDGIIREVGTGIFVNGDDPSLPMERTLISKVDVYGGGYGIYVSAPEVSISQCRIRNSTTGIHIADRDASVDNCEITDVTDGVTINTGSIFADSNVSNVTVRRASSSGFNVVDTVNAIGGSDGVRFIGCRALEGTGWGFRITGDNIFLSNCIARNNSSWGVRIVTQGSSNPSGAHVTDGEFGYNGAGAIQNNGTGTVLRDNLIY